MVHLMLKWENKFWLFLAGRSKKEDSGICWWVCPQRWAPANSTWPNEGLWSQGVPSHQLRILVHKCPDGVFTQFSRQGKDMIFVISFFILKFLVHDLEFIKYILCLWDSCKSEFTWDLTGWYYFFHWVFNFTLLTNFSL